MLIPTPQQDYSHILSLWTGSVPGILAHRLNHCDKSLLLLRGRNDGTEPLEYGECV